MKRTTLLLPVLAALSAVASAFGDDASYSLGVPHAPCITNTTNAAKNPWLSANDCFAVAALFAPVIANLDDQANALYYAQTVSGNTSGTETLFRLVACEGGFVVERSKPEYWLADRIDPPEGVDWVATYARFQASGEQTAFLFDPSSPGVYAADGGSHRFDWVLLNGSTQEMTYTIGSSCQGRPRRIYWTDKPYNAPGINLAGKFVKFFGDPAILDLEIGANTTLDGGQSQTTTNKVVRGLYLDSSTSLLQAVGKITGQVIMAYYDSGNYDVLTSVQVVEVAPPRIIQLVGKIGSPLQPDGGGYDTTGLVPKPTVAAENDNRGPYLYQHRGPHSYSPKNDWVYPLRPTPGEQRQNAQVYWMETDAMGVQWPFEVCQYECDWPEDTPIFVRGDQDGDGGRPIFIPSGYTATLQGYQDPEGHAEAVTNGVFVTTGEGYSLLKITGPDNVWFLPIHSVSRSNADYFTLKAEPLLVGSEARPRFGVESGATTRFTSTVDSSIPGYIYRPTSGTHWNVNLYRDAKADTTGQDTSVDPHDVVNGGEVSTNEIPSVVYAVNVPQGNKDLEVWWCSKFQLDDMPDPIEIPCLPQRYTAEWPADDDVPQIVIASQLGSANESLSRRGISLEFTQADGSLTLPSRECFGPESGTLMFWTRASLHGNGVLATFGADGASSKLLVRTQNDRIIASFAGTTVTGPFPDPQNPGEWTHVALTWQGTNLVLYVDAAKCAQAAITAEQRAALSGSLEGNSVGSNGTLPAQKGRAVAEISTWRRSFSAADLALDRYRHWGGAEPGITCYISFESDRDFATGFSGTFVTDRVFGTDQAVYHAVPGALGPFGTGIVVLQADTTPKVYVQNDRNADGFNPNEEHGLVRAGNGGYVAWALRCDLNREDTSYPAVLVEYVKDNVAAMQYFAVVLTNAVYPALSAPCTAGTQLPGPHPLDLFDDPWLPETKWEGVAGQSCAAGFRDRKGQIWARCAGTLPIRMYYAMQEGFWFPSRENGNQPAVGTPIPWLACLSDPKANPLTSKPALWTWNVHWPENAPEMRIGQTLTTATGGLPEVWNASSVAVLYPDQTIDKTTVLLTDPTVARTYDYPFEDLSTLGMVTGPNEKLSLRKGKYYFNDLPPSLSDRIYLDPSAGPSGRLVLVGKKESNPGGVELLHFNVLNKAERAALVALADRDSNVYKSWVAAFDSSKGIGTAPVEPSKATYNGTTEVRVQYDPVDHYAITALGGTNYVTIIENDARDTAMVAASSPISMHVFKVVPEYYTGRLVTREDPVNLLSQQLDVLYEESFAGKAGEYVFEWRRAAPRASGVVPDDYENEYTLKFPLDDCVGLTRFTIGAQGDTLANMVNTYYAMRYRAASPDSVAYAVMGDTWSDWCMPALAEGWIQRVLNNVTPFTQRMRDLYENAAETSVSMIQQAGAPFEGDVALNQENLTSIGLIQLYQTLLNKAETMSLLLGVNDGGANKQLLLAAERLGDLYTVLGDEAYSDAMNPTIGFGSNFGEVEGGLGIDYGAASSSLFCFDNQMPSLLEEELALLRGRSGANAPSTHLSPYFNRLVWNYTRGITAGEVAYAVNYNITGTRSATIDYQQAATLYPQGHGDAYGHYLSALMGWYRLLRNPYFSWGLPSMGEMVVADSVVNVDYYDEAKFAAAAAKLARTAADVVERTARKVWADGNVSRSGGGYLDEDASRAFGYGEWASRGGYGGLCNWVVANSLLPGRAPEDDDMVARLEDEGLLLIDRTTVSELSDIAFHVGEIQTMADTADRGANPLGFVDGAVPFDITPIGASDGSHTHYEQIRDRAVKALDNARKVLDHAQSYGSRLRMIEEAAAGYEDNLANMERDYDNQLIAIFGYPYSDDIGPAGTYVQGYDGPDLYHYMWMDYAQYGLEDMLNPGIATNITVKLGDDDERTNIVNGTITFTYSSNGLIQKPKEILGTRRAQGEIQQAYADFIVAFADTRRALKNYNEALEDIDDAFSSYHAAKDRAAAKLAIGEAINATKVIVAGLTLNYDLASEALSYAGDTITNVTETIKNSTPTISGAGLTVNVDPRAMVTAALAAPENAIKQTFRTAAFGIANAKLAAGATQTFAELGGELLNTAYEYVSEVSEAEDGLDGELSKLAAAGAALQTAWARMISTQEAYNTIVAKGQRILEARELSRQQAVNNITKMKYNDMFFRLVHNEALSRYNKSFDIAQRYVFLAAKAYDYETGLLSSDPASGEAFLEQIIGARSLGEFDPDGTPLPGDNGDPGLADILYRMDANWDALKPRLGINNPQPYATWFSLRRELFRILPGAEGDAAWRARLAQYRVNDLLTLPAYRRFCQPLQCSGGLREKEPGFVIPFSTTIDFAKNFFGQELAGGDSAFDSTYFATKIAAAGVWFDGYNARRPGYTGAEALSKTPQVYLIPIGADCIRAPGQDDGSYLAYNVVDQTIPVPYAIGASQLGDADWVPFFDGLTSGVDLAVRIRRYPSFRAYYGDAPSDAQLDCPRLVGRSVWNTQWLLIIPAGNLDSDREAALAAFLRGKDTDRDGVDDLTGVTDIRIGFKTYATSGN